MSFDPTYKDNKFNASDKSSSKTQIKQKDEDVELQKRYCGDLEHNHPSKSYKKSLPATTGMDLLLKHEEVAGCIQNIKTI